jgi:hypothetical protein
MWNKIYFGLLLVALISMGLMTFWCFNWLGSVDKPETVATNLMNSQSIFRTTLLICSGVLMIISNVLLWTKRSSWALWTTFIFFAVFIMLQTWWLNDMSNTYLAANGMQQGIAGMGIVGTLMCIITAIGVFFNQFIVFRMLDKMSPAFDKIPEKVEKENG